MADTNAESIEKLETAATQPKQVTVDGVTVQAHSLKDQIELDQYLGRKKAAQKGGMRFQQYVPPGTA